MKIAEKINKTIINSRNKIIEIDTKSSDNCSLECIEELKKSGLYKNNIKYRYYFIRIKLKKSKFSDLVFIKFDTVSSNFVLSAKGNTFSVGKEEFDAFKDKINKVENSTSKEFENRKKYLFVRKNIIILSLIFVLLILVFLYVLNNTQKMSILHLNDLNKFGLLSLYTTLILALEDCIDVESKNFTNLTPIIITRVLIILEYIFYLFIIIIFFFGKAVDFNNLHIKFLPILSTIFPILVTLLPIVTTIGVLILKFCTCNIKRKL